MTSVLLENDQKTCAIFSVRACQLITLTLRSWDLSAITESLQQQLMQAPDFFKKTSILLHFDLPEAEACDLDRMNTVMILLQHHELQILGCIGPSWVRDLCGFFQIPFLKDHPGLAQSEEKVQQGPEQAFSLSLPVRPGQQYVRQGDLILLAPVHHGAEILATGHIHAYARTQGRLIAGINGDKSAQIFCSSLQAQLISIAGVFLTKDLYPKKWLNQPCRIFLAQEKEELEFEPLS